MTMEISLPPRVLEVLQTTYLRVKPPAAAFRLWEQFLSRADRRRLGGDFRAAYRKYGDTVGMLAELRGVTGERALVDVGVMLGFLSNEQRQWLLREVGEVDDGPEEMILAAVQAGGLVISDKPRTVYWQGRKIELDWFGEGALWRYLLELARRGKSRSSVEWDFDGGKSVDGLTKLKSKLNKTGECPESLLSRIDGEDRGYHRLEVEPTLIRIFERVTTETIREWTA